MLSEVQRKYNRYLSLLGLGAVLALLVSTLQVPVTTHWCGGKVFARGIYAEAAACGMETPQEDPGKSISAIPCCSYEVSLIAATGLNFDVQSTGVHGLFKALEFMSIEQALPVESLFLVSTDFLVELQRPPPRQSPGLFDLYHSYLI